MMDLPTPDSPRRTNLYCLGIRGEPASNSSFAAVVSRVNVGGVLGGERDYNTYITKI